MSENFEFGSICLRKFKSFSLYYLGVRMNIMSKLNDISFVVNLSFIHCAQI